jgi:hypothetical protein
MSRREAVGGLLGIWRATTVLPPMVSGGLTQELADGFKHERWLDLGNCEQGDGPRYRGRGPIQVTGKAHHAEVS